MKKKTVAFGIVITMALVLITVAYASINANSNSSSNTKNADVNTQTQQFADVKEKDWFCEDVTYVNKHGLMKGTSDCDFSPAGMTTRGMIVTILWRLEREPIEQGEIFEDVKENAYYHNAVAWASNNEIVNGYSETKFGPDDATTREQLVTIMYRYASYKKYDTAQTIALDKYSDKNQISEYAVKSIQWANASGIISGMSEDIIAPKENVQRCQVAAILRRFCENYKLSDEKFTENSEDTSDKKAENNGTSSVGSGKIIGAGGGPDDPTVPPEDIPDINAEAQRPTLKVNTTYGNPGDSIKVIVDVQNNPGILGMILQLEYDEDAMLLVNAENGEAISDVLTLTTSKDLKSGAKFVWDGLEIDPSQIENGSVLNLEFKLSENAVPGKRYPLSFKYNPGDIVDSDLKSINSKIIQGFIEIKQKN